MRCTAAERCRQQLAEISAGCGQGLAVAHVSCGALLRRSAHLGPAGALLVHVPDLMGSLTDGQVLLHIPAARPEVCSPNAVLPASQAASRLLSPVPVVPCLEGHLVCWQVHSSRPAHLADSVGSHHSCQHRSQHSRQHLTDSATQTSSSPCPRRSPQSWYSLESPPPP